MSEPVRLRDPGSAVRSELRALLTAAEPPPPLPAAARERVRRVLVLRRAAAERNAACWSHALGLALASATCAAWLLVSQREPGVTGLVANAADTRTRVVTLRTSSTSTPTPTPTLTPTPALTPALTPTPALALATLVRGPVVHRPRHERWAKGTQRSRKRIAALVDEILSPEAQMLDRAKRAVEHDPEQALALIDAYRQRHPGAPIPAPSAIVEVDALRRLGRFEDALARARALLESTHRGYYADEMAQRFALLDL